MSDPAPNFWQDAVPEILDAAHAAAGVADAATVTAALSPRMAEWRGQYLAGELTAGDLESLVRGEQDLTEFDTLAQAGAADIALQRFAVQVLEILAKVAVRAVI